MSSKPTLFLIVAFILIAVAFASYSFGQEVADTLKFEANPDMYSGQSYYKEKNFTAKKIAIVTFYTRDDWGQRLKRLTFHNFQAYAKQHDYMAIDALDNIELQQKFIELKKKGLASHHFKVIALRYFLPNFDWVMWADGDSIFLNFGLDLIEYCDTDYDVILSVGAPNTQHWKQIVNAGHYLIRNTEWSLQFLKQVDFMARRNCQEFINPDESVLNGWLKMCGEDGGYWLSDQGILQILIQWGDRLGFDQCHIKLTGFRDFNSEFPWYEDGDLVVHFPGRRIDNREELIGDFYMYTDFEKGIVDRTRTKILNTEYSHWQLRNMTDAFKVWNHPCRK